jgi:hypothetical protein
MNRLRCLIVVVGLTALVSARQATAPPEPIVDGIPANALAVAQLRVADVWGHEALKPYHTLIEKAGPETLKVFNTRCPLPPSQIEAVSVVLLPAEHPEALPAQVVLLHLTVPADANRLAPLLGKAGKSPTGFSIVLVHPRLLALGHPKTVAWYLTTPIGPGPLTPVLKSAAAAPIFSACQTERKLWGAAKTYWAVDSWGAAPLVSAAVDLNTSTAALRWHFATADEAMAGSKTLETELTKLPKHFRETTIEPDNQSELPKLPKLDYESLIRQTKKPKPATPPLGERLFSAPFQLFDLGQAQRLIRQLEELKLTTEETVVQTQMNLPEWWTLQYSLALILSAL